MAVEYKVSYRFSAGSLSGIQDEIVDFATQGAFLAFIEQKFVDGFEVTVKDGESIHLPPGSITSIDSELLSGAP